MDLRNEQLFGHSDLGVGEAFDREFIAEASSQVHRNTELNKDSGDRKE
jgi:hypothetical protein